jgi:putative ABC transport system substrate-binding protein
MARDHVDRLGRRRVLKGGLAVAGLGLLSGCRIPFGASAQPARLHRIGHLLTGSATSQAPNLAAFRQGLGEFGYVEDQNVTLALRYAEGREERLPELAAELVGLDVDVLVTASNAAIRACRQATGTVPIVFAAGNPVVEGLVASDARPGGNITGLTHIANKEHAKRLQLLTEAVPGLSRVAVLWNQSQVSNLRETEAAAQVLGVRTLSLEIPGPDGLDTILDVATTGRADGLVVTGGPVFSILAPRIVEFAARHRLPAMYSISPFIDTGGLMIYGVNIPENHRRAATYVDKILKGAKPADLPIERPSRFDLIVNLKTAQALGITIPPSVLQQATEVIQ